MAENGQIQSILDKLKESEEKYRILYEYSADAIMTLEPPDWRFTSGNLATVNIFKLKDEKEFISLAPWQVSPEYQPDGQLSSEKAIKMINKAMQEGANFFEWTHKRYKGENFPATVLLTRMKIGGKNLLQAIVRDVSEYKRAEQILEDARSELALRVKVRTAELSKANEDLHLEIKQRIRAEEELRERMQDLERFSNIAVDRELRMEELENKIKELEALVRGKG